MPTGRMTATVKICDKCQFLSPKLSPSRPISFVRSFVRSLVCSLVATFAFANVQSRCGPRRRARRPPHSKHPPKVAARRAACVRAAGGRAGGAHSPRTPRTVSGRSANDARKGPASRLAAAATASSRQQQWRARSRPLPGLIRCIGARARTSLWDSRSSSRCQSSIPVAQFPLASLLARSSPERAPQDSWRMASPRRLDARGAACAAAAAISAVGVVAAQVRPSSPPSPSDNIQTSSCGPGAITQMLALSPAGKRVCPVRSKAVDTSFFTRPGLDPDGGSRSALARGPSLYGWPGQRRGGGAALKEKTRPLTSGLTNSSGPQRRRRRTKASGLET